MPNPLADKMQPWMPAPYEVADVTAVQAIARGDADEHQQKRFYRWLLAELCRVNDLSFRPDSQRASDFAEGKRFVGLQVMKLFSLNAGALAKKEGQKP